MHAMIQIGTLLLMSEPMKIEIEGGDDFFGIIDSENAERERCSSVFDFLQKENMKSL